MPKSLRNSPGRASGVSLKAQALAYLSRREHSRQELRVKLLAALHRRRADDAGAECADADADAEAIEASASDPSADVDTVLDWLAEHGYLSDARFVESRINVRGPRQGSLRIRAELARHGLALDAEQAAHLRETEFARAQEVWRRKYGQVASEPRARATQARFLAARGFAADVVRRIVGGEDEF